METLAKYLAVAGGGAVGACLRFYLGGSVLGRIAQPFPTATFVINITGSFIVGFFLTLVTERIPVNPHLRLLIAVGFVGAYTTFSTFEYETAQLVERKDYFYALLYVVLSFVVGFAAVWAGILAARRVEGLPVASHAATDQLRAEAARSDLGTVYEASVEINDSAIGANETDLLAAINQTLPTGDRTRLKYLVTRGEAEEITGIEVQELIKLTDRLEKLHAERLAALAELGRLRGITLDEVINNLGIRFPDHD